MRACTNAREASETGAYVQPQLPTTSVVTPCRIVDCAVGLVSSVKSLWLCGSTKPGQTTRPAASIVRSASAPSSSPTAAIREPSTATSPRNRGAPVPSTTSASLTRTSTTRLDELGLVGPDRRRLDVDDAGADARVEDVPQPVAEEVEPEHDQHDRGARPDRHPDVRVDVGLGRREHV